MKTARKPSEKRGYHYAYPHPAVTVDGVVLRYTGQELQVLLIRRAQAPYAGQWAFPGGFIGIREPLDAAVCRELAEETGLVIAPDALHPLGAFGAVNRDPRERIISVVFVHLLSHISGPVKPGSDAAETGWFDVQQPPGMAFDHAEILRCAVAWLRDQARLGLTPLALLPPLFKFAQVQRLCELIAGHPLDKRNFRRHLLPTGLFIATGKWDRSAHRRPAQLYRLSHSRWRALHKAGLGLIS
jgi:8-oxo-dGTP diphosphatase